MISETETGDARALRCFASLRLFGDALAPVDINRLLQVEATEAGLKGQVVTSSSGKTRTAPTGRWILESQARVSTDDLEQHVGWLIDRLEAAGTLPLGLPGVQRADVCCYWEAGAEGGPEFSPVLLGRLSRLGLKLGLDIYPG